MTKPETPSMSFTTREGRALTLVLVHGFLDSGEVWAPVRDRLAEAGYRTIAVDLPGMGSTEASPEAIGLGRYADDLRGVTATIDGPVVLVGQSMGAQVAELAAVGDPKVVGLALLAPVPLGGVGAPEEMVASFKALAADPSAQRAQRAALSHAMPEESLDMLVGIGSKVRPEVGARLVDVWNQGHEQGAQASAFTGPVLVIRAAADPFIGEDMAAAVLSRFPNSNAAVIERAGHWPHVEQPDRTAELLLDFVRSLQGEAASSATADWQGAFARKDRSAFAQTFADDVVLEASTLVRPVKGREDVQKVMEAASRVYSALTFTDQAASGAKQYVEWVAEAHEGVAFGGVTVITRNAQGAIAHVAIHHRPMEAAIFFSKKMAGDLAGVLEAGYFLQPERAGEVA